jgi:hypothetical protein
MKIKLYPVSSESLKVGTEIKPGERFRDWMSPHAYRCLPMTAANTFGWDIVTTQDITFEWDGGKDPASVYIFDGKEIAESNFGMGTITVAIGYIWHTEPDIQLMTGPVPNPDNNDFHSLTGLIETDRLKYPWFVTLQINRPGKFTIKKGTPITRVFPVRIKDVTETQIIISDEPEGFKERRDTLADEREKIKAGVSTKKWTKIYHTDAQYTNIKTPEVSQVIVKGSDFLTENNIMVAEDYLTLEECAALIELTEKNKPLSLPGDAQWDERTFFLEPSAYPPELWNKITKQVENQVGNWFKKKMVQSDPHLVRWNVGNKMSPHSDYAGGRFPNRDYNVIIYLNDNYVGGHLILPSLEAEIVPKAGCLLSFHGGNTYHGVKEITKGTRYTCISWLKDLTK